MEKLREMIEERRASVKDHESGHRKLADDQYELAARQLKNFSRKLKVMEQTNNRVSGDDGSVCWGMAKRVSRPPLQ